jgi:hypothetical protein
MLGRAFILEWAPDRLSDVCSTGSTAHSGTTAPGHNIATLLSTFILEALLYCLGTGKRSVIPIGSAGASHRIIQESTPASCTHSPLHSVLAHTPNE